MRTLTFAAAVLAMSLEAFGQGQFAFNNHVPPVIDARLVLSTDAPGTSSMVGSDYSWQLEGGPKGVTLANAQVLGYNQGPSSGTFRTGLAAGYVNPPADVITVSGLGVGEVADVFLSIFSGPTPTGNSLADFGPYTVALDFQSNNLPLGTSPLVIQVPEPSSTALVAFGLGVGCLLLLYRRRLFRVGREEHSPRRF